MIAVMRGVARRFAELPPAAILALGWLVVLVYAYPGMMTMDSIHQLAEGRRGFYTDGHPPLMSFIWRWVDKVIAGPFGMLVLQTVSFLAGMYFVLRHAMRPRRAAV